MESFDIRGSELLVVSRASLLGTQVMRYHGLYLWVAHRYESMGGSSRGIVKFSSGLFGEGHHGEFL